MTSHQTSRDGDVSGKVNSKTYQLTLIAALGGFLFGYDTAVISGTTGFVSDQFSLDAVLLGWFVSCALFGCVIGVLCAGFLRDRFGTRPMLISAAVLFTVSAIGCMFAGSFESLVVYRFVGGLGVGIASMLSPLYIAEIAPPQSRGRLVSLYQLAITVGILVAYFANAALLAWLGEPLANEFLGDISGQEVWRAMLGSETIPALLFLVLLQTVPESPRWLMAENRSEDAYAVLMRVNGKNVADKAMVELRELASSEQARGLGVLFRQYRKPAAIGIILAILQQLSGINAVIYYGPDILERAGLAIGDALGGQVIIGLVNVIGTFVAVAMVDRFGRRPLMAAGALGAFLSLLAIAFLFRSETPNTLLLMTAILAFIACFAFSYGPVVWIILSEIFPTHLRGIAMATATFALWIGTLIVGQVTPWLLENIEPSGTFFLFAICTVPAIYLSLFVLPETKERTLEQIEKSWRS